MILSNSKVQNTQV